MAKIVMLGLDGATFDLILPWVHSGRLPHFAKLLNEGIAGPLRSTIPPMSPPAWNSFMTGTNPGKHGIYDFTGRKPHSYETQFINASWRRVATLWHHMSQAGKRVAVLSVPFTYPPEQVNGIMVSGMDAPGVAGSVDRSATYPPELCDDINRNVGDYPMGPNLFAYTDPGDMVDAAVRTIEKKAAAARYLYAKEEWDFFMFVLGETDAASHRFWRFHDPNSPLRENEPLAPQVANAMLTIYQKADEVIGQFLAMAAPDTTFMVMSDHGNGGDSDKAVYLNRWLESQGLLKFKTVIGAATIGVEFAKQLGLRVLPPKIKTLLFRMTNIPNMMESWTRFAAIDWKRTRAFSEETPYFPSIWINLKGREPLGSVEQNEYDLVCEQLITHLTLWRDPYTGQRMVKRVYRKDDVYSGPHAAQAPDLTIEWELDNGYSYLFRPSIGRRRAPVARLARQEKNHVKSGDHRDQGIFLATGPDLARPTQVKELKIIDLAPTVLYVQGLPIPSEMDGQVLTQLFTEEYLAARPIHYEHATSLQADPTGGQRNYSADEEAVIRSRLQGLGYIE